MSHIPFFSIERYELMASWLWQVTVSQATWVQILQGAETATPRPFCVALCPSVHWHVELLQGTYLLEIRGQTDHYYVIITYHYVTTAKGSITTHHYIFPGLADACARLAHVAKSGPLPDSKCFKTVEVGFHVKSYQGKIATDVIQEVREEEKL